ncbi:MAG TPA: hypothetical protein VEI03_10270 [Stellaceae bacterium]|nr:hypothetical protein [Stellaceae bacterium]
MPRKFRLTCARTTYFDIDVMAEDGAEAERLVEAAFAGNPALCDNFRPIGKPTHRIVEIAALEVAAEERLRGGANEKPAVSERRLA